MSETLFVVVVAVVLKWDLLGKTFSGVTLHIHHRRFPPGTLASSLLAEVIFCINIILSFKKGVKTLSGIKSVAVITFGKKEKKRVALNYLKPLLIGVI